MWLAETQNVCCRSAATFILISKEVDMSCEVQMGSSGPNVNEIEQFTLWL